VIGIYVDDLLIAGAVDIDIDLFKQEMQERFRMSDLRLLSYYLGIEVHQEDSGISLCQEDSGISLCQSAYAQRLLEKMDMGDCNPCFTPMESGLQLVKSSSEELVDATEYQSVIRCSGTRYTPSRSFGELRESVHG
jgi:hypothetical protein